MEQNTTQRYAKENGAEVVNCTYGFTRLLNGSKVILRNKAFRKTNKVAVISGCGEAREILSAGLVGPGLLSAVVLGSGFASPQPEQIFYALREIKPENNAGVLAVIVNTVEDLTNFRLAVEYAEKQGIKVQMLVVGEDCISMDKSEAIQHSGLISSLMVMKICSALAETGESLESIAGYVKNVLHVIGTVGEIRVNELAAAMIEHVIGFYSKTKIDIKSNSSVGLIINSSGKLSEREQLNCTKQLVKQLELRGVTFVRCWSRHCITPWENASLQMSLVPLDDRLLQLLDWDCVAPSWPKHSSNFKLNEEGRHLIMDRQVNFTYPIVETRVEAAWTQGLWQLCGSWRCMFCCFTFSQCKFPFIRVTATMLISMS